MIRKTLRLFQIYQTRQIQRSLNSLSLDTLKYRTLHKIQKNNFCVSDQKQEQEVQQENVTKQNSKEYTFQTETKRLLHIVAHSLYTDKDVFLRELLSNASDALEKQKILELKGQSQGDIPLQINIMTNKDKSQLIIQDTGIGMTKDELIQNLGTIASSGSKKFLEELENNSEGSFKENLIGQFGVGFYSSFIVGDTIDVISKRENDDKAHCWTSDGSGSYSISEVDNFHLDRGTKLIIHLKPEFTKYAQQEEIKQIIDKYSNFITHPIYLNHEKVNVVEALWNRTPQKVKEEEYQKFYEYITNSKSEYQHKLHYKVEVPLNIKSILYIPKSNPEQFGLNSSKLEMDLYSKRVLIKKNCPDLLPNYLRFVRGVVDCEDIPLNISRENYQDSSLIQQIRKLLTKRVLKLLEQEAKKNPEGYNKWIKNFHLYFKEGMHTDKENSQLLLSLSRFDSTFKDTISLDDYLANMKKEQQKIYFFLSSSKENALQSPYMEIYTNNDIPVLLISINIEEMIFQEIGNYKGFQFENIESVEQVPDNLKKQQIDTSSKQAIPKQDEDNLMIWIRSELQPVVTNVKISKNLTSSPAIIQSQMTTGIRQLMAMMQPEQIKQFSENLTLEINPNHEIMVGINKVRKQQPQVASNALKQVLDSCLMQVGIPFDVNLFVKRINNSIVRELKEYNTQSEQEKDETVFENIEIIEEDQDQKDNKKRNKLDLDQVIQKYQYIKVYI